MRRIATIVTSLALLATGAFVLPSLSQAASGTGVYGTWSLTDNTGGTITFPGTIFPGVTVTSTNESLQLATSATLNASTPFGLAYGPSNGKQYLSAALAAGKPSGTVTLTFDTPPTPGTYGFALGDIDAENIKITATDAAGRALSVAEWLGTTFNYAPNGTDLPNWDAATGVLTGNGTDTDGASLFFVTSDEVKSITFEQVRAAGFPRFQLWIAADVITTKPVPSPTATASATIPKAPDGKVVICHRTNSRNNPYVQITVSEDSIDRKNGHDTHDGPIFPAANWGDIIPPFTGFAGQNWPAGSAILNNGCEVGGEVLTFGASASASASASPSTSVSGSPSGTASPSASATASGSASASPTPSGSVTASSSPSAAGSPSTSPSPSPSVTGSPSASASASTSASPSASAPESASASPTASASASPSPSPSVTPEVIEIDPTDPTPTPVDPEKPTIIEPGPGKTITDAADPKHGTIEVRDGDVIYTPEPGYVGPVEIPVTITDRDGATTKTVITLSVGEEQTARVNLPDELRIGTNVLLAKPVVTNARQRADVTVECTPMYRVGKAGGAPLCVTSRSGGRTVVQVNAPAKVTVSLSAPAKGDYGPYEVTKTYKVRFSG